MQRVHDTVMLGSPGGQPSENGREMRREIRVSRAISGSQVWRGKSLPC